MSEYPRPLAPVTGPFAAAKIDGAAEGMGDYGDATRSLVAEGLVPPDFITGMTLALLARQPRLPRSAGEKVASGETVNGVSGRVWVRERFTIHRPIARTDAWVVSGETTGGYTKRGRAYSTTRSSSVTSAGDRFATNLTTGLLGYRPDPTLADGVTGLPIEETPAPEPDRQAAANNPCLDRIRAVKVGDVFGGERVLVSLAMMTAHDTANPDNPIHSDVEQARKAGLSKPIAGGSHVLAFALEAVMRGLGSHALLHGANFDISWKAPTENDVYIVPRAAAVEASPHRVAFDLSVDLESGPVAMVGRLVVPLP